MVREGEIKEFFSAFWKVDVKDVNSDLKLDDSSLSNQNSIRFYQFIAAVESNFDVKVSDVEKILTFGDLIKNIDPL